MLMEGGTAGLMVFVEGSGAGGGGTENICGAAVGRGPELGADPNNSAAEFVDANKLAAPFIFAIFVVDFVSDFVGKEEKPSKGEALASPMLLKGVPPWIFFGTIFETGMLPGNAAGGMEENRSAVLLVFEPNKSFDAT
jgi:hypothetical protein